MPRPPTQAAPAVTTCECSPPGPGCPQGIRWLRDLLRSLAAEGRAVLVSSHILAEVAQTVDDVIVISRGQTVTQAPLSELLAARPGPASPQAPARPAPPSLSRGWPRPSRC
jgi:ABC-type glutathione transport system ATPase component